MTDATLIMWSISEIAARDSVSKMAISKQVKKLIAAKPETPVERDGLGRVMKISLAHYDEHRARHVNPAKASAPLRTTDEPIAAERGKGAIVPQPESFEEARRQSEWLKVGRERIRHQEAIGALVRTDRTEEALRQAGRDIQAMMRRLQNRADDVALAVSKEGVHGARVALRRIADEVGNDIADRLAAIASEAPEVDEPIEGDDA